MTTLKLARELTTKMRDELRRDAERHLRDAGSDKYDREGRACSRGYASALIYCIEDINTVLHIMEGNE